MPMPEELKRAAAGPQNPREQIWWEKYSHENLQKWRHIQDPLADNCTQLMGPSKPSGLLQQVEERAKTEGGPFQAFLDFYQNVPAWVDFKQMELGRQTYQRYFPLVATVLACSSLVEGYAHNKPSQVLISTGRLQKDSYRRIIETGQMLHNIYSPTGLRPGSSGVRTLMEVRLLHAMVRQFLRNNPKWDVEAYDLPINQEDMAGTVLEFDFMVVRGLKRLGLSINRAEHESMHYLWRYAGYLLGVDESLLTTTIEEQEVLALQLTTHLYDPTPDGEALAKALLRGLAGRPPLYASEDMMFAFSRHLVGKRLAKDFHLKSRVSSALAVGMVKQAITVASVGNRLLPQPALRLMESVNNRLGRNLLIRELGGKPADWAFKSVA